MAKIKINNQIKILFCFKKDKMTYISNGNLFTRSSDLVYKYTYTVHELYRLNQQQLNKRIPNLLFVFIYILFYYTPYSEQVRNQCSVLRRVLQRRHSARKHFRQQHLMRVKFLLFPLICCNI